jgi:hypothetical protein
LLTLEATPFRVQAGWRPGAGGGDVSNLGGARQALEAHRDMRLADIGCGRQIAGLEYKRAMWRGSQSSASRSYNTVVDFDGGRVL